MKLLYSFLSILVMVLFSSAVFAHNGSHESKNCFFTIEQNTLRFSGFQFQGSHPNQAYCRIFPYLGDVIIKIESVNTIDNAPQISLQIAKLDNSLNFQTLKTTPFQNLNNGVNMIQTPIQEPGIYAVQVLLQQADKSILWQRFLFLVGVPIAQILVILSGLIFLLIVIIFLKQNFKSK